MSRFVGSLRAGLVGAAVLSRCVPAWGQSAFETDILTAHNSYRGAVQVAPLTWDPALAADASDWAWHLGRTLALQHSSFFARHGEGENLWMGTAGAYSVLDMVQAWGAEQRNYTPGFVPDVSRTGDFAAVAHYTQVVWRETRRVGCAIGRSAGWDILVCRYATEGNVVGQLVF